MMERLHQAANSWVFKGLLVMIIGSLLLAGIGDYFIRSRSDHVAIVNGTKISRAEFEQFHRAERQRLQAQRGDSFSSPAADPAYFSQLKQQILTQQIKQRLLEHYVKHLGLRVSDESVKTAIRKSPQFQTAGHFDNALYLKWLYQRRITPEHYSVLIRQQLLQQQLIGALVGSEFVLPEERDALFALVMQQREVQLATLTIEPLIAQQSVDDLEAKNYYDQHANDFIIPEQLKISYITFSAAALQAAIQVSEQDIQHYYQQHPQRYSQAAQQNISLIRVPTEQQATALLTQLQQPGSDFSRLAKAHSTDHLTAKKGGLLGWVTAGSSTPAFEQAAFALKKSGELSGVVTAEDGYYLLRLNKRQPEQLKPLKQVHAEIAQLLRQRQAVEQFQALQQQVRSLLGEHPDSLIEIAAAIGVKVEQSPLFSRETIPPSLDFVPLVNVLFNEEHLQSGQNSEIIDVGDEQAFVVRVEQHQAAASQPFEQVLQPITTLVKREKALRLVRQQAVQLLLALRSGQGAQALRKAGVVWGKKQLLTRQSPDHALNTVIFSHPQPTADRPSYGITENAQGNIVLFELLRVTAGGDPKGQSGFSAELLEHKITVLMETLWHNLYQQAKIKLVNLDDIE